MKFAEIVRSSSAVRNAFNGILVYDAWWRLVLALHGKPSDVDPDSAQSKTILARGFRFYGYLYASLAGIMLLAVPLLVWGGMPNFHFWAGLLVASFIYLSLTCQLAFSGACRYSDDQQNASLVLVAFFLFVIAYLSCFCGACLAISHFLIPAYDLLVSTAVALLLVFGTGSYLIEVLFLVSNMDTNRRREHCFPSDPTL